MQVAERKRCAELVKESELMLATMSQIHLLACVYHHRMLKLARTIVESVEGDEIQSMYLAETLWYRPKIVA